MNLPLRIISLRAPFRSTGRGGRRLAAASLTEILVSLAVIAILMVFLIPGFSAYRNLANIQQCAGNMRQQYAAAMAYAVDHGVLPGSINSGGVTFYRQVASYLGYDATKTARYFPVFMCPERPLAELTRIVEAKGGSINYGGYIYNPYVCGIPANSLPIRRLSEFRMPANVWMIGDGNGQASPYVWKGQEATVENRIAYAHLVGGIRKTQLLMLDGHIEFKSVEEMKANEGNFWQDPRIPKP